MAQYAQKVDRRQISYFSSFVCFLSLLFWLIWLGVFREKASPKPTKQIKYEGVQLPAGRTNHAADSVLLFGSPRNVATHLKAEISAGYWGKRAGKLWVIAHRRGSAAVGFFFFFELLLLIFLSLYFLFFWAFTSSALKIVEAGLEYSKAAFVAVSAEFEVVHAARNLGQHNPAPAILSLYSITAAFQALNGGQSPVLNEVLPALIILLSFQNLICWDRQPCTRRPVFTLSCCV